MNDFILMVAALPFFRHKALYHAYIRSAGPFKPENIAEQEFLVFSGDKIAAYGCFITVGDYFRNVELFYFPEFLCLYLCQVAFFGLPRFFAGFDPLDIVRNNVSKKLSIAIGKRDIEVAQKSFSWRISAIGLNMYLSHHVKIISFGGLMCLAYKRVLHTI